MSKEDILGELEKEKREEEVLEEGINNRALKIGRMVLDEICLHSENSIEINIRKSSCFDWSVVEVGVHSVTGMFNNQVEYIKRNGLGKKMLNAYEIIEKH